MDTRQQPVQQPAQNGQQTNAQAMAQQQARMRAMQQAVQQQAGAQRPAQPQQMAAQRPAQPQQAGAQRPAQPQQMAAQRPAQPQQMAAQRPAQPQQMAAQRPAQPQQTAAQRPAQTQGGVQKQVVLRMFQPDMQALKALSQQLAGRQGLKLNLYGQAGEVMAVFTAQMASAAAATELVETAANQMETAMGESVYGREKETLADAAANELVEADMMLAAADALTGHLLEVELKPAKQGEKVFDFGQMSFRNARMAEKIEKASLMDDEENPTVLQQAADRSYAAAKCTKCEFGAAITGTQGGNMVCAAVTYKKHVYVRCIRPAQDAGKTAALTVLDLTRRLLLGLPVTYARMFLAGEEIDWNNPLDPSQKQKGNKMLLPILLLVAVGLALGVGIYAVYNLFFAGNNEKQTSLAMDQSSASQIVAAVTPESTTQDAAAADAGSVAAPDAAGADTADSTAQAAADPSPSPAG